MGSITAEPASRAAFIADEGRFDVRDIELPPPGPGQISIRVAACGVCGSNLHEWHAAQRASVPAVAGATGHEISAVVESIGDDHAGVRVGDRVAIDPSAAQACGKCEPCRDGAAWFCRDRTPLATYGFADRMTVFASSAHPLPEGVDVVEGAVAEPIACGVHAVRHSWTARADGRVDGVKVAVIGAGMLGLAAVLAARHLGAEQVVSVARHPHQKELARLCGATDVLDPAGDDLAGSLRRFRPELVVEAVGATGGTLGLALDSAAWRGEVAVLGSFATPQLLDVARALNHEKRIFFAISYAARDGLHDMDVALEIMGSGAAPVGELVTHRFGLDRIGEAFATADDKTSRSVRVVVTP